MPSSRYTQASTGSATGGPVDPGPRHSRGRRRRWAPHWPRRTWSRVTLTALIVIMVPIAWSVGHALTMPGGGSVSERLAEWARDHYLGPVVTMGEWLTYQPPKVGGKPSFRLTGPSAAAANRAAVQKAHQRAAAVATYGPPAQLQSMAGQPLPGEGVWRILGTVNGDPAIYGTYLRPSSVYEVSSVADGIVSMNQSLVRFELRPGAEDPGPGAWHAASSILPGTRRGLLATFNSGFKISTSDGGFYLNGATSGTLTPGVASEVYYSDGHMAIGVWGQTVTMTPDVVGVRQNLHLIVAHGHVPPSVDNNVETNWGATLGGGYYVWRSEEEASVLLGMAA